MAPVPTPRCGFGSPGGPSSLHCLHGIDHRLLLLGGHSGWRWMAEITWWLLTHSNGKPSVYISDELSVIRPSVCQSVCPSVRPSAAPPLGTPTGPQPSNGGLRFQKCTMTPVEEGHPEPVLPYACDVCGGAPRGCDEGGVQGCRF